MKKLLLSLFLAVPLWANTSRLGLEKPDFQSERWDQPINRNYDILDSSTVIYPINLGSGVTGTLPAENTVSSTAYTTKQNTFTDTNSFQAISASSISLSGPINTALTPNQCVQVGAAGLLTTSGAGCSGGGGGASALEVISGVARSSPTPTIIHPYPQFLGSVTASSMTVTLNGSSVTLRGTSVVNLQESLQLGATFFVSSGTILGQLTTNKVVASTLSVSGDTLLGNLRVTGTNGVTVDNLTSGRCVQTTTGGLLTVTSGACNVAGSNYSQSFTGQTSVVLSHNTNTTNIIVSCYDNATIPNYIGFNSLALTDANSATVTFASAQTGTCIVASTGGGGDNLGNHIATTKLTTSFGILASTITVSTMTVSSATIANLNGVVTPGISPILGSVSATDSLSTVLSKFVNARIVQVVQFAAAVNDTTTSATYVVTADTITITPTSASNKVLVFASGALQSVTNNKTAFATLSRNGTNLGAASGWCEGLSVSGGTLTTPCSMVYLDSPATTATTGYAVQIKSDGVGTVGFGNTGTASIVAIEIGQ